MKYELRKYELRNMRLAKAENGRGPGGDCEIFAAVSVRKLCRVCVDLTKVASKRTVEQLGAGRGAHVMIFFSDLHRRSQLGKWVHIWSVKIIVSKNEMWLELNFATTCRR